MKKFLSILTLAAAITGTAMAVEIEPKSSPKGMALMKSETGFKLFYKGNKTSDVTVKIYNQKGVQVFSETIKNLDSFIRPYNMNTLKEGEYTVELTNSEGKASEKVTYTKKENSERLMDLVRVKDSDQYLLRVANKGNETLSVKVYDAFDKLVYQSSESISGDFAKLYNLRKIGTNFRFEITDGAGSTKQLTYSK